MLHGLPNLEALRRILGPDCIDFLPQLLDASLVEPVRNQLQRERKQLRSRLLRMGYELARPMSLEEGEGSHRQPEVAGEGGLACEVRLRKACDAIELLHEGSLMIDDIQDNSPVRRGSPCVHLLYGVPTALCTGNWLYFWPLRLLGELGLAMAEESRLVKRYTEAVEKAHYGQALDVHAQVHKLERHEIAQLSRKVSELKTGVITALAMEIGATIAGATAAQIDRISAFGCLFGVALQNFDDIGNLSARLSPEKRFEDMLQKKPSFVWAFAAEEFTPLQWQAFLKAVEQLPHSEALEELLGETNFVHRATEKARSVLGEAYALLNEELSACQLFCRDELHGLGERLINAYG